MYKKHFLLISLLSLFLFSECKKGEDDPLISLRTRKARVAGKWKIQSGKIEQSGDLYYAATGQPFQKLTTTYSENSYESRTEGPGYLDVSSGNLSYEVEFKKNGDYVSTSVYDHVSTRISIGTWNFMGKVGDHKNKEQIVIHLISQSYSSTGPNSVNNNNSVFEGNKNDVTYSITELRNKKIVLVSESFTTDASGKTSTLNTNLTFIQ